MPSVEVLIELDEDDALLEERQLLIHPVRYTHHFRCHARDVLKLVFAPKTKADVVAVILVEFANVLVRHLRIELRSKEVVHNEPSLAHIVRTAHRSHDGKQLDESLQDSVAHKRVPTLF